MLLRSSGFLSLSSKNKNKNWWLLKNTGCSDERSQSDLTMEPLPLYIWGFFWQNCMKITSHLSSFFSNFVILQPQMSIKLLFRIGDSCKMTNGFQSFLPIRIWNVWQTFALTSCVRTSSNHFLDNQRRESLFILLKITQSRSLWPWISIFTTRSPVEIVL